MASVGGSPVAEPGDGGGVRVRLLPSDAGDLAPAATAGVERGRESAGGSGRQPYRAVPAVRGPVTRAGIVRPPRRRVRCPETGGGQYGEASGGSVSV